METVAGVLGIAGALLMVVAGVGLLRLPDIYARMHAAAKVPTLGLTFVSVAAALTVEDARVRSLLAVALLFATAPAASHLVARAAYRAEGIDIDLDGPDDLAELLVDVDEPIEDLEGPED